MMGREERDSSPFPDFCIIFWTPLNSREAKFEDSLPPQFHLVKWGMTVHFSHIVIASALAYKYIISIYVKAYTVCVYIYIHIYHIMYMYRSMNGS